MRFPLPSVRRRSESSRGGKLRILPLLLFAGFALYYVTVNKETVPITGRTHLVDISREQEAALGLQSYREVLQQSRVIQGGQDVDRIKSIGLRLSKVVESANFNWEFNLIESAEANAFCLPGGKVAVYTGILPVARNNDGLAVIMGHEIAHAVARHGAERMAQQRLKQIGSFAVGSSISELDTGTQRLIYGAYGLGTQFGIMLPYSRKHESEADYMGLIYVARSCFNPEEAPKVWERMLQANKGVPPEFLSTHPDPRTRIAQFREWMPEALQIRAEHCASD